MGFFLSCYYASGRVCGTWGCSGEQDSHSLWSFHPLVGETRVNEILTSRSQIVRAAGKERPGTVGWAQQGLVVMGTAKYGHGCKGTAAPRSQ